LLLKGSPAFYSGPRYYPEPVLDANSLPQSWEVVSDESEWDLWEVVSLPGFSLPPPQDTEGATSTVAPQTERMSLPKFLSSPQTASVSLTHQHELQPAITNVDSDKAQSLRPKSSTETTGGSDNGITNLEPAGSQLQQERAPIVSQSDVGSQLQQVSEAQVPRRSTVSPVDDGGLGGLQRLEIWTGKSHPPERFDIILRLWSLLLRHQGSGRAWSMFSRVPFSLLSPFPLDCLRVCGLSLPPFLSPSVSPSLSTALHEG